jgi:hypothetical protein
MGGKNDCRLNRVVNRIGRKHQRIASRDNMAWCLFREHGDNGKGALRRPERMTATCNRDVIDHDNQLCMQEYLGKKEKK